MELGGFDRLVNSLWALSFDSQRHRAIMAAIKKVAKLFLAHLHDETH